MRLRSPIGIMGVAVLLVSLVVIGCESDAQRIRGTNAALATPTKTSTSLSAEIDLIEIQDGDCINSTLPEGISIETAVIVPCSGTWQYRALNSFEVTDSIHYPGEDFFSQRARESCDRRYNFLVYPHEESWESGYREVSCLQEEFGLSATDPAKLDRLVSRDNLNPRECYDEVLETNGLMVELVSCSSNWQYRVINSFEVEDSDSYPGEDFLSQQANTSCDPRYTYFLFPTAETWAYGHREITCIQGQP